MRGSNQSFQQYATSFSHNHNMSWVAFPESKFHFHVSEFGHALKDRNEVHLTSKQEKEATNMSCNIVHDQLMGFFSRLQLKVNCFSANKDSNEDFDLRKV
jgi:hypothetical protein